MRAATVAGLSPGLAIMRLVRRPLALLAGLLVAGCVSTLGPGSGERGIVVSGTGRVAQRPDAAAVAVGAEARMAQLASATATVDRTMRDVLARLKTLGVGDADVRTIVYTVDPIAEPRQPGDVGARIVGYRVANIVQVRTRDVDALGRLVDAAVGAGANVVRDVQLTLADPARAEAEARALAVQDARAKARQVAAAAGVGLGRLLAVSESSPVRPVARTMSLATGPGPVAPGELEVMVTLEARFAIEP